MTVAPPDDVAESATPRPDGRLPDGRFGPGNKCSHGNVALRRLGVLQQAVRDAIEPADIRAVLEKLRDQAKAGDTHAATVLLANVIGRPREQSPIVEVALPDLATAGGITDALARVAGAIASGDLDPSAGESLTSTLQAVAAAGSWAELEQRVSMLERPGALQAPQEPLA